MDNNDVPLRTKNRQGRPVYTSETMREAQDVFGAGFDFDDIDGHGGERNRPHRHQGRRVDEEEDSDSSGGDDRER